MGVTSLPLLLPEQSRVRACIYARGAQGSRRKSRSDAPHSLRGCLMRPAGPDEGKITAAGGRSGQLLFLVACRGEVKGAWGDRSVCTRREIYSVRRSARWLRGKQRS